MLLTTSQARTLAEEWIAAFNSHDLDRVLSHYAEDFTMSSPFILRMYPESGGSLTGKANIRAYWAKCLERFPDLHFTLHEVMHCINTICIVYTSVLGLRAVEWLNLEEIETGEGGVQLLVTKAAGHYDAFPEAPSSG